MPPRHPTRHPGLGRYEGQEQSTERELRLMSGSTTHQQRQRLRQLGHRQAPLKHLRWPPQQNRAVEEFPMEREHSMRHRLQ